MGFVDRDIRWEIDENNHNILYYLNLTPQNFSYHN